MSSELKMTKKDQDLFEHRIDDPNNENPIIEQPAAIEQTNKIHSIRSNTSSPEKTIELNLNIETNPFEEQIKENLTIDNTIKEFKEPQNNDEKELLPELLSNRPKIRHSLKDSFRLDTKRTDELFLTITDKPFNKDKRKFQNYTKIKNYLDESNLDNSNLQTDSISVKNINLKNIDMEIQDSVNHGINQNINSYTHLKGNENNFHDVNEKVNQNKYEKVNDESMMFNITKEVKPVDYYDEQNDNVVINQAKLEDVINKFDFFFRNKFRLIIGIIVFIVVLLLIGFIILS